LRRHETTQTLLWARKVKGRRRGCRCGDEESGLDIVGGDDDEIGAVDAGVDKRALFSKRCNARAYVLKNGNDDSEQNALAPERIENPQRSRLHAEVNSGQKSIGQRKLLEIVEGNSSESEPDRE